MEDEPDTAESVKRVLNSLGHDAEVALDGYSAMKIAARYRPDAVFLDLGLPGLNGYDVARLLREIAGLEGIFIIALTGSARYDDRVRAFDAGCDHYVIKPLEPASVKALLGAAE